MTPSPGFESLPFVPCVDPPSRHWFACALNMLFVSPAVHSLPLIPTVDCHPSVVPVRIQWCLEGERNLSVFWAQALPSVILRNLQRSLHEMVLALLYR